MLKYNSIILLFIFLLVNSIAAIPAPQLNNQVNQQFKQGGSQSKFVEIKLPGKITSVDDLFSWVKNAMQNMASKIDVKLGGNDTEFKNDKVSVRKIDKNMIKSIEGESKGKTATPRNTFVEYGREPLDPWSKNGNEIYAPLLNVESFLPYFSRDIYPDKLRNDYSKYAYNTDKQASESSEKKTFADTREVISSMNGAKQSNSDPFESSTENHPEQKTLNGTGGAFGPTPIPFAIPFEAFITITREPSYDSESPGQTKVNITTSNSQSKTSTTTTEMPIQTVPICNHSKPFFERNQYNPNIPSNYDNYKQKNEKNPYKSDDEDYIPYVDERRKVNSSGKGEKFETPKRNKKKESARKRQIAALGSLLETLGVIRKNPKPPKVQEAATTSSATTRTTPRPRGNTSRRPSFEFGDESPRRPSKNQTSQRQEFDYYDDDDDDDDDDDEQGGSLGSVADLLPLALPILEDLSNPESEADLIEVIQSAIPIIQGLSEVDEDDDGGLNINDLIEMILPAVIRIINGREGQGIDLGALVGPIFGLLAPFIGPVLAPLIGPLIRTISNPPTEGSSLAALLSAIAGPLSTPQEPSGMSPLSIVIAGAAAALLKELRPGAPGGSDIGALVGSILSGVLAGTSAGLSGSATGGLGGLSGNPNAGPAPYGAAAPVSSSTFNVGFTGRPSPGPPINSPFINHPTHVATVNIGSTARPPYSSTRPSYSQHQVTVQAPQRLPSPHPQVYHHSGPVSAATTGGNGGSSYLPTGSAVPAASVNPLQLIGTTVQDILGAGIQVVSSLINVVFGIIGGSSASDEPTPSYGAPGPYGQASG